MFKEHCADHGVQRHLTAPYTPQQNGVVERRNQTVLGMARSMMKGMNVPGWLWGEVVCTAVFILNRSPTRSVDGKTPFEVWYGYKPAVHFFRTFDCTAHVKVAGVHLRKLDDRSTPMAFIGYEPGSKAYRFYNPSTQRVCISRDAVFEEGKPWNWGAEATNTAGTETGEPFTVEYVTLSVPMGGHAPQSAESSPTVGTPTASPGPSTSPIGATVSPSTPVQEEAPPDSPTAGTPQGVEFVSPPSGEPVLDDDADDAPLRFRTLDNVLGDAAVPGEAVRELGGELLLAIDGEPSTFEEARHDEAWRKAMLEELGSIEENKTWSLVDLPHGHRAIGLKWVFKIKRDEQGAIVKHKARLVAKGYVQKPGIDYEEAFAPVARMESVRVLLAVAAQEGWLVHHMDVKSAFLNGDLVEEVYVQQPPGFVAAGHQNKALHLKKALYGLRQAPRAWNQKLDASLCELGFNRCTSEHGMYTRGKGQSRVVVGVYVDDLIITGAKAGGIEAFKAEMSRLFRMSDLGLLSYYLGIEVRQSKTAITLGQAAYARKLLQKANMAGCNSCSTPMEARLKLSKEGTTVLVDATEYRSLVGSLRYLVHTRPNISFAVGFVSRFMEKPRLEHMAAVKHLLRYIAGTIEFGIVYPKLSSGDNNLIGYSDSDLGGGTLMTGRARRASSFSWDRRQWLGSPRSSRWWPSHRVRQSTLPELEQLVRQCGSRGS